MNNSFQSLVDGWAQAWFSLAWPLGLSSCLVIGVVWGITRLLRHRGSAALRSTLWLLVLARLGLPAEPILPLHVESLVSPVRHAFSSLLSWPEGLGKAVGSSRPQADTFGARSGGGGNNQNPEGKQTTPNHSPRALGAPAVTALFLLWLGGVLGWGTLNFGRYRRLRRQLRQLSEVATGPPHELFCKCRQRLAIPRWLDVRLYSSPDCSSPFVIGFIHPKIILPQAILRSFPPSRLEPLLLHELAHVKRWDPAVLGLQLLLQVLHWPNPLVWLANRQLRVEREQACDDWVLAVTRFQRRDYGRSLVQVLEMARCESALSMGLLGVAEPGASLQERLKQIMNSRRQLVTRLSLFSRGCLLLLGAVLLATAPVMKGQSSPAKTPQQFKETERAATSTPTSSPKRPSAPVSAPIPARDEPRVLAAREECFPLEVCEALLALRQQESAVLDPAGKLEVGMQALSIDRHGDLWGIAPIRQRNQGDTLTGEYSLGNTDGLGPMTIISDDGSVLKHRRLMRKPKGPGQFELMVTLDRPWPAGEEKSFYWIMAAGRPKAEGPGEYSFKNQNLFGPEGIQQLLLVLPAGYRLRSESEPHHAAKDIGNNRILLWQKHVQANENYRVDLVLVQN